MFTKIKMALMAIGGALLFVFGMVFKSGLTAKKKLKAQTKAVNKAQEAQTVANEKKSAVDEDNVSEKLSKR